MKYRNEKQAVHGFTMVETLVALVVLAVGMLGVASLFVVSLRSGSSAIYRMHAINLASDLADRIRANRLADNAYAGASSSTSCVGASVTCSPQQMAAYDLYAWQSQIAASLPGSPTGTVVILDAGPPKTYQITITWTERNSESNLSYELQTQI